MRGSGTAGLCLLLAACGALPLGAERLAVLPLQDASGDREAAARIEELLAAAAAERGWEVVRGEAVETALREVRLRRVDSIPAGGRTALLDRLGASAVLVASLHSWRTGREGRAILSARLQEAGGEVRWSDFVALTAPQTADPFDLRRAETAEELAAAAVARLRRGLPAPGHSSRSHSAGRRPLHLAAPAAFRAADALARPLRAALVPFTNNTSGRDASRVLGDLVARHLAASGAFEVVEPADFRTAMVAEAVPSIRHLDPDRLAAVGRRLGADLFVRGAVWRWVDPPAGVAGAIPEIEIEVELVDVASRSLLAAAHVARRGDDYAGLLGRHTERTAAGLADRAVGELLAEILDGEPAPRPAPRPPTAVALADSHPDRGAP